MKKRNVRVIITGIIVAVIGVIVLLVALGASGWNWERVNNWQEATQEFDSKINKLKIDVSAGKVIIKRGKSNVTNVTYSYNEQYKPEIVLNDGGVLTVKTVDKHWYDFRYWFTDAPIIEIAIPEKCEPEMNVSINAGTVEIGDGEWNALINVKLNAGAVSIGDVVVENLNIEINAGAVQAGKIQAESVTCRIKAGAFDAKKITCKEFECNISAGAANVKKLDSSQIRLDVSAGSVELGLVDSKLNYRIDVEKSAGSCNVTTQTVTTAERYLKIDISAGSVEVTFDN